MKMLSSCRGGGGGGEGVEPVFEGLGGCFLVAAFIGCSFKVLSSAYVTGCRRVKRNVRI